MKSTSSFIANIGFLIFFVSWSYCQDTLYCINDTNQIIYRGVENNISIKTNLKSYRINCINCDLFYIDSLTNDCVIVPGGGRYLKLNLIDTDDSTITYKTFAFPILYLPDPALYLGNAQSSTRISHSDDTILTSYKAIGLSVSFDVLRWQLTYGRTVIEGEGSILSDKAKKIISGIKVDNFFALRVWIREPSGIMRTIGGAFSPDAEYLKIEKSRKVN